MLYSKGTPTKSVHDYKILTIYMVTYEFSLIFTMLHTSLVRVESQTVEIYFSVPLIIPDRATSADFVIGGPHSFLGMHLKCLHELHSL